MQVEGVNVIGIADKVSNKAGAVLVVGADYDSSGIDDPMYNNGAGVAAMLEAAYHFYFNTHWSGMYVLNYTTIFVAFDLNTKEHVVSICSHRVQVYIQCFTESIYRYNST